MKALNHGLALTFIAVRSIPARLGITLVAIIGTATAMTTFVALLALGEGVEYLARGGVRADRAYVLSRGAQSSLTSAVPRASLDRIATLPGIKRDPDGTPLAGAVALLVVDGITRQNQRSAIGIRAMGPQWRKIWPELQIVEGRFFASGLHELIVSDRVRDRFQRVDIGSSINVQGKEWKIVGAYHSTSSFFDNLMLADADTLLADFPQATNVNSVDVVLESPAAIETLKAALARESTVSAQVKSEAEAHDATVRELRNVLNYISYFIGGLMGLGAACAALASLYASVDTRTAEIATLRAVGFSPVSVVFSILAEALLLSVPATLLGAGIAWYLVDGNAVAVTETAFQMKVTARLLVIAICSSLFIAFIGALLPSIRAATMPIATGVRAT